MSDTSVGDVPFEEQRRVYELLSQETRHLVLQYVLGHPSSLPSLDELAYMVPKNKAAIRDQLQVLAQEGILQRYDHPPNRDARDLPSQFYGLTEHGVEVLHEYNYLRGLPIARAVYDNTRLSEKARRHRDAPRPDLPAAVERALTIDEGTSEFDRLERYVRQRNDATLSADAQVEVARAFYDEDIGPDHEGIKRTDVVDLLDVDVEYRIETVLSHLVEIDVLEETTPPGPDVFAISERIEEIVDGRITEEAEDNVEALVAHVDDELRSVELADEAAELGGKRATSTGPSKAVTDGAGRRIRRVLADEFEVAPERVDDFLRSGDPVDRLNAAVEAIESAEEVTKSEEYGRLVFVSQVHRYRLTDRAMDLLAG